MVGYLGGWEALPSIWALSVQSSLENATTSQSHSASLISSSNMTASVCSIPTWSEIVCAFYRLCLLQSWFPSLSQCRELPLCCTHFCSRSFVSFTISTGTWKPMCSHQLLAYCYQLVVGRFYSLGKMLNVKSGWDTRPTTLRSSLPSKALICCNCAASGCELLHEGSSSLISVLVFVI